MDIGKFINQVIRLEPESKALEFKGRWHTWGQVSATVDQISSLLDTGGVSKDAGVAVMLRNRPAHFATLLALFVSQRCVMLVNPMQPPTRIREDLLKLRTEAVIFDAEDWAQDGLVETARSIGSLGIQLGDANGEWSSVLPGCEVRKHGQFGAPRPEVGIEMLTSGTTGTPKRVPLPRRSIELALTSAFGYERGRSLDDPPQLRENVIVLSQPFTHLSGVFAALSNVLAGRSICLLEKFSVEDWRDGIKRHGPRVANAVPTALRMILDADVPKEDIASLVAIRSGSAPLPPETVDEVLERYGIPVLGNYGATEFAGGVAGWSYRDFKQHWTSKRGSVGRIQAGIEARIVDPGSSKPLAVNEVGLLAVRGKQLGDGESWVQTTDLARLDEDGFLFVLGRADHTIIRGGFKVSPGEVAKVLESHPAIREAAVVGVAHRRLGEVPVAAMTVMDGAEAPAIEELEAMVRERMTAYSVPAAFKFVKDLPRTPVLKVAATGVKALFEDTAASGWD